MRAGGWWPQCERLVEEVVGVWALDWWSAYERRICREVVYYLCELASHGTGTLSSQQDPVT